VVFTLRTHKKVPFEFGPIELGRTIGTFDPQAFWNRTLSLLSLDPRRHQIIKPAHESYRCTGQRIITKRSSRYSQMSLGLLQRSFNTTYCFKKGYGELLGYPAYLDRLVASPARRRWEIIIVWVGHTNKRKTLGWCSYATFSSIAAG